MGDKNDIKIDWVLDAKGIFLRVELCSGSFEFVTSTSQLIYKLN